MTPGMRVLLVEDNPDDAAYTEALLRRAAPAVHVTRVETADAGVAALARAPFDAIVTDLALPDSAGTRASGPLSRPGSD